jgi:hypothetical protein
MMTIQFALLIVFLYCGLIYSRATKELIALDELRIAKESPSLPKGLVKAGNVARRMFTFAPGGEELEKFCERNGFADKYRDQNRRLYGAIAVALVCAAVILWLTPAKSVVP